VSLTKKLGQRQLSFDRAHFYQDIRCLRKLFQNSKGYRKFRTVVINTVILLQA